MRRKCCVSGGVAQVACNLWGPQAVEAFGELRDILKLNVATQPYFGCSAETTW